MKGQHESCSLWKKNINKQKKGKKNLVHRAWLLTEADMPYHLKGGGGGKQSVCTLREESRARFPCGFDCCVSKFSGARMALCASLAVSLTHTRTHTHTVSWRKRKKQSTETTQPGTYNPCRPVGHTTLVLGLTPEETERVFSRAQVKSIQPSGL